MKTKKPIKFLGTKTNITYFFDISSYIFKDECRNYHMFACIWLELNDKGYSIKNYGFQRNSKKLYLTFDTDIDNKKLKKDLLKALTKYKERT